MRHVIDNHKRTMKLNRYALFSWGTLGYVLLVIVWGAYVRATGSGAGCGSHWPLCNGTVVPRAPGVETLIEFTHRVTSGLALLLVVGMVVWARRIYPRGHLVRRGAAASLALMILEALLGAGLVVFGLVAEDDSVARAISMALHLVNTFLLVGAITLTCWWASGGAAPRLRGQGATLGVLALGVAGFVVLGVSGAVTALGDTLFSAISMSEARALGITHWLLPLRIFHPLIAIVVGSYLILAAGFVAVRRASPATRRLAAAMIGLILLQLGVGYLNVYLRAPVWLQGVHLLLADLVWIALVLLCTAAFSAEPARRAGGRIIGAPFRSTSPGSFAG
jgi:heme A synthase